MLAQLFKLARSQPSACIGLELGPQTLRLLQLEKSNNDWLIKNYAEALLPPAAIVDGKIYQPDTLQHLLRNIVKATHTQGCAVVLALPANAVISQQISLPAHLPTVEYEIAINMNLGRYFPGVSDVLYFDFVRLPVTTAGYQQVLLLAARQWQVDSYAALVNAAGLRVQVIDVDYLAMLRALPYKKLLGDQAHKLLVCLGLAMHSRGYGC